MYDWTRVHICMDSCVQLVDLTARTASKIWTAHERKEEFWKKINCLHKEMCKNAIETNEVRQLSEWYCVNYNSTILRIQPKFDFYFEWGGEFKEE